VEALWHSIVNAGIVIAAFVVAVWCAHEQPGYKQRTVAIIAAMLVWLSMAWRKVFRKLELEEEVKQNET
jgi:hypothetical protein